jgi:hypothetical protein
MIIDIGILVVLMAIWYEVHTLNQKIIDVNPIITEE